MNPGFNSVKIPSVLLVIKMIRPVDILIMDVI